MKFVITGDCGKTEEKPVEAQLKLTETGYLRLYLNDRHIVSVSPTGQLLSFSVMPDIGDSHYVALKQ